MCRTTGPNWWDWSTLQTKRHSRHDWNLIVSFIFFLFRLLHFHVLKGIYWDKMQHWAATLLLMTCRHRDFNTQMHNRCGKRNHKQSPISTIWGSLHIIPKLFMNPKWGWRIIGFTSLDHVRSNLLARSLDRTGRDAHTKLPVYIKYTYYIYIYIYIYK